MRVGSLSTGIASVVAPAYAALRRDRPGLDVRVVECDPPDVFSRLDAGDLDVVLTADHRGAPARHDPRYHRVDLLTDVLDVVLPAGHPLADEAGIRLAEPGRRGVGVGGGRHRVRADHVRGVRRGRLHTRRPAPDGRLGRRRLPRGGGRRRGAGAEAGPAAAAGRARRLPGARRAGRPLAVRAGQGRCPDRAGDRRRAGRACVASPQRARTPRSLLAAT
ncbi:hypothetical protein GCM10025868_08880 [Angustibacter aerolatus]|uniref:LysR substrate-binding domain-containing protein n=1 Tax=Angustibacter aerolatus TaxID=1162965 RepID=A0ABQ6JDZ6_9ACTN|nr:LysR substrate-binding domain-containing protein [Angustibacter aerolatus]GMA85638.1 hypothetical protein GCM10025868_08880 [Angustibacter aerolatus]